MDEITSTKSEPLHNYNTSDSKQSYLSKAIESAFNNIAHDPLLKCFKENESIKEFTSARIKEIIEETFKTHNDVQSEHLRDQIEERDIIIAKLEKTINELEEDLQSNKDERSDLEKLQAEVKCLKSDVQFYKHSDSLLKKELENTKINYEREIRMLEFKIDDLEYQLENYENFKEESLKPDLIDFGVQIEIGEENEEKSEISVNLENDHIITLKEEIKCLRIRNSVLQDEHKSKQFTYQNEIQKYRSEIENIHKKIDSRTKTPNYVEKIRELEKEELKIKNEISGLKGDIHLKDNIISDLESQVGKMKQTVQIINQKLIEEQQKYLKIEMEKVELSRQINEFKINYSLLEDNKNKLTSSLEFLKKQEETLKRNFKSEVRKSTDLIRELEKCQFDLQLSELELDQRTKELREKNDILLKENKSLLHRVNNNYSQNMMKIENLHQEKLDLKKVNLELQEQVDKYVVENENLSKKIDFYKNKVSFFNKNEQETNVKKQVDKEKLMKIEKLKITFKNEISSLRNELARMKTFFTQNKISSTGFIKSNTNVILLKFKQLKTEIDYLKNENNRLKKSKEEVDVLKSRNSASKNYSRYQKTLKFSEKKEIPKEKKILTSTAKKRKFMRTEPLVYQGIESVDQSLMDIKKVIENSERESRKNANSNCLNDTKEFDFCLSPKACNSSFMRGLKSHINRPEHEIIEEESLLIRERINRLRTSRKNGLNTDSKENNYLENFSGIKESKVISDSYWKPKGGMVEVIPSVRPRKLEANFGDEITLN